MGALFIISPLPDLSFHSCPPTVQRDLLKMKSDLPWLVWLSGLSICLQRERLLTLIPSQDTYLGCDGPGSRLGACERQPADVSLPLFLFL